MLLFLPNNVMIRHYSNLWFTEPHSGLKMEQPSDDSSVPTIWVTTTPSPVVTPHPNAPLVEEIHYENGVQRRSKRDVVFAGQNSIFLVSIVKVALL